MIDLSIAGVSKIVFTGINGTILIIPLIILLKVMVGQARDLVRVLKDE